MRDLKDRIIARIRARGRGEVYVTKDFLDLGGRAAVDQALSRLVKDGTIRRIGRGLFDYPRTNPKLGIQLTPDADRIAQAVARKRGSHLQRSGAFAANALGLSTQVPGREVYLTDSSSGKVRVGKQTLTMKHVSPKMIASRDKVTGPVMQALYFIGKDGLTDDVLGRLRGTLSDKDKRKLLRESRYAVGWVADAVKRVVRDDKIPAKE
ncbi:MAG: DUF6088 family protein [Singulisphaera sp.]